MPSLFLPATISLSLLATQALAGKHHPDPFPFNPGFDIKKVAELAESLPSHSWEYGTASEMLLELYNPEISVFGDSPFPAIELFPDQIPGLKYAKEKIVIGTGANGLSDGDGAVGDPASLGVPAVLLGKTDITYAIAAKSEVDYMKYEAPRWFNGAISHRADVPELWADFIYMAPPFLAYYAVDTFDEELLQDTVEQCGFYREALQANISHSVPYKGVWEHIVGPQSADLGLWSTGNAWAAGGMTRVLATVKKAIFMGSWREESAIPNLTQWIKEIVDGAMGAPMQDNLLRNYLNDTETGHGFGEVSGSSLIAAVIYRMAVMQPETFGRDYISWADTILETLAGNDAEGNPHITASGIATPAVNPLGWSDTTPFTTGSPEGNNFVVLLYVAWRDCIQAGVCSHPHGHNSRRRFF